MNPHHPPCSSGVRDRNAKVNTAVTTITKPHFEQQPNRGQFPSPRQLLSAFRVVFDRQPSSTTRCPWPVPYRILDTGIRNGDQPHYLRRARTLRDGAIARVGHRAGRGAPARVRGVLGSACGLRRVRQGDAGGDAEFPGHVPQLVEERRQRNLSTRLHQRQDRPFQNKSGHTSSAAARIDRRGPLRAHYPVEKPYHADTSAFPCVAPPLCLRHSNPDGSSRSSRWPAICRKSRPSSLQ